MHKSRKLQNSVSLNISWWCGFIRVVSLANNGRARLVASVNICTHEFVNIRLCESHTINHIGRAAVWINVQNKDTYNGNVNVQNINMKQGNGRVPRVCLKRRHRIFT